MWNEHPRHWVSDRDARCSIDDVIGRHGVDISAGKWRDVLWPENTPPAVHRQHEVVKRWLPEAGVLVRFAGLGRYGDEKLRRSQRLADAGLGPQPLKLEHGFLWLPFVASRSWGERCEALADAIAHHCAFLTRAFAARRSPSVDALFEMILTNVREGCTGDVAIPELESYRAVLEAAPCAAIDGRMLPHEWLRTHDTFVKVDALDHHQDHFFPGTQDAGWDLASASFELDLDSHTRARMIQRYAAESRDADIAWRMPFYDIAYPAFRLGYAVMAAQTLGASEDGQRFGTVAARCRRRLAEVTAGTPRS